MKATIAIVFALVACVAAAPIDEPKKIEKRGIIGGGIGGLGSLNGIGLGINPLIGGIPTLGGIGTIGGFPSLGGLGTLGGFPTLGGINTLGGIGGIPTLGGIGIGGIGIGGGNPLLFELARQQLLQGAILQRATLGF